MKFKDINEIISFVNNGKATLPEWQRKLFARYRDEIQVHSNGELFYKLDKLFPNEHPESKNHRLLAFEPITKGSFWKGVTNVEEIFHNSSYSIEASERTIEHIGQNNFEGKNLFNFFLNKWCEQALTTDPNSLAVVYPFEYSKATGREQLQVIGSEYIKYKDADSVIFISENESECKREFITSEVHKEVFIDPKIQSLNSRDVTQNTYSKKLKTTIIRAVLHVFTTDAFFRMEQKINTVDEWEFSVYRHNKNFLPVEAFGGMIAEKNIYESFFSVFVPFGNLALLQHSQHTAVNFVFSFPRMSEMESPCDNKDCRNGEIIVTPTDANPTGRVDCGTCLGTGYTVKQSPYKVYRRRIEPNNLDEKLLDLLNFDDVKYYTPPVEVLNYSKQEWKDYLEMAEASVYVSQKVKTGNVESEGSKEMDRKDRYNFLAKIAKAFYPCVRNIMQFYENYLNNNPIQVSVNIPYSFAIVSENEALQALESILLSNAPVAIKASRVEDFINKYVSQGSPVKKIFALLRKVDLLIFYTDDQILKYKMSGVVTPEQVSIHAFAFPVLSRMYYEDRGLFDQEEQKIIDALNLKLAELKPETDLKTNLLNKFSQPDTVNEQ